MIKDKDQAGLHEHNVLIQVHQALLTGQSCFMGDTDLHCSVEHSLTTQGWRGDGGKT